MKKCGDRVNMVMSTNDYRAEIDQWAAMWDEMEKSNIHPKVEKPKPAPYSGGNTARDTYYDYFDSEDQFAEEEGEALLQEEKTPNPVYPDSQGVDQDQPAPVWASEKLLKEVESLKNRLFKVENAVARMGQGKGWTLKPVRENSRLMSEIKSLRSRIDKVSSQLGIADEPSPWEIKLNLPGRNVKR